LLATKTVAYLHQSLRRHDTHQHLAHARAIEALTEAQSGREGMHRRSQRCRQQQHVQPTSCCDVVVTRPGTAEGTHDHQVMLSEATCGTVAKILGMPQQSDSTAWLDA
jgi:hypothetical protein